MQKKYNAGSIQHTLRDKLKYIAFETGFDFTKVSDIEMISIYDVPHLNQNQQKYCLVPF